MRDDDLIDALMKGIPVPVQNLKMPVDLSKEARANLWKRNEE